jgi:hypothetical protein
MKVDKVPKIRYNPDQRVVQIPNGDTPILIEEDSFFKALEEAIDEVLGIKENNDEC